MITFEEYSRICEDIKRDGFNTSFIVDYDCIKEKWEEMIDINENKMQYADFNSKNLILSYLFALRWGITSLAVADKDNDRYMMAFQGLFSTISNTIISIIKLAIDGLDYQAFILIRNLYELCFTLLAIIIDPIKRKVLVDGSIAEDEYNTWKKNFTFKHLDATIRTYENRISDIESDSFLNTWRKNSYSKFSSYAHNDFVSFFLYGFALPVDDTDKLELNLWGVISSRVDSITGNINALLWYTELVFIRLLTDKTVDLKKEELCKAKDGQDFWNLASFVGILSKKYYIQVRENEEIKGKD